MRIGIDVGGTNTDAVLMKDYDVLFAVKRPTTADALSGIKAVLSAVENSPAFDANVIDAVMLGTTHFTNAVVVLAGLSPTAVVRLALPTSSAVPPMRDWPEPLADVLGRHVYEAHGGCQFDGVAISEVDLNELELIARDIEAKGIGSIAIISVFAPVKPDHELIARAFFEKRLTNARISVSHEIGRVGLIERENATIINAALLDLADHTMQAFKEALTSSGLSAPLYLSQNDGTLMSVDYAKQFPVTTFASGPTNSMRGAALLSGLKDCIVIDIGGTTTDIGMLVGGFPRQSTAHVNIGGVRTNFRMPDLLPIGIGGGSLVDLDACQVGPQSIGYKLSSDALVFGGSTLTATDLAVAAEMAQIGDKNKVAHLNQSKVHAALESIRSRIAVAADMMRTSREPVPVVLVGGGNVLIQGDLPGLGPVVRPAYADCANAVGAAIAQIGIEIDRVLSLEGKDRNIALRQITVEAKNLVIRAGAHPHSVEIAEIDELPIGYMPHDCVRVRVKAIGNLALGTMSKKGVSA